MNENIILDDLKILDDLYLHDWEINTIKFNFPDISIELKKFSENNIVNICFGDVRDKIYFQSKHTQISVDRVYGCDITKNNIENVYNKYFTGYLKKNMIGRKLIAFEFNTESYFVCVCSKYTVIKSP